MTDLIGTEHEYSINDDQYRPLPISDEIIRGVAGMVTDEVSFGEGLKLSKELQKHAIELVPDPSSSILELEQVLFGGIQRLYRDFPKVHFLGLGMHPLLTLDQTCYWDHEEAEYYQVYDRLFNIHQHGWLNIQALQINFPYHDKDHMVLMFNKLRSLIPYLVAVSAASPFVEGRATGTVDNRLIYYRSNQAQIPEICHGVIPEKLSSHKDYLNINRDIYKSLLNRGHGAEILCREWVNSRGVIVRFSRRCLEIKALDEQECLHSDMAVAAFIRSLLRCDDLRLEDDHDSIVDLLQTAIDHGTSNLLPELLDLYAKAELAAHADELAYLPLIKERIVGGSLSEVLMRRYRQIGDMRALLREVESSLRLNVPYRSPDDA